MGRGQLNSSVHAISVAVMPQWTLEHRVFAHESFVKSGETIVETQRLFRCRFNIGRHGNIPSRSTILRWVTSFRTRRNDNEEETAWSCRNCTNPGERGKSERGHREGSNPFCSATCCRIRNFSYINSLKWHVRTYHFVIINKFYTKN